MTMSLSRDEVQRVSLLARLELSDPELDAMTTQLAQIVAYVEQLGELDTADVAPMAHAIEISNVLADDQPREGLPRDEALANAPKRDAECYLVPAVLGD